MQFPELPPEADDLPESPVDFHFEDVAFDLPDPGALAAWLVAVARAEGKPLYQVSFIFCSDEYLRQVNVQYLDHDYYTDVITFPLGEAGEIRGDVFISGERVAENAATHGVSFSDELCRVMVHAILHLAGYGDKTPEEQAVMRAKEDFYLKKRAL